MMRICLYVGLIKKDTKIHDESSSRIIIIDDDLYDGGCLTYNKIYVNKKYEKNENKRYMM